MSRRDLHRPFQALSYLLLALVLVCGTSAQALAIDASTADDVCAPTDDPCNVSDEIDIADGSTLDFGLRQVNVTNGGRFDFQSGSGVILCGELDVNVSGAFVNASGPIGFGETAGGLIQIESRRGCTDDATRPCLRTNDCFVGTCSQRRCSADTTRNCSANADCEGTCESSTCSNKVQACATNADCNFGPCPSGLSCSADLTVSCSANTDCNLGSCDVGDGTMEISGNIAGGATEPAVVILRAVGDVDLDGLIAMNGGGTESDGGELSVDSFNGTITVTKKISATGGGLSQGGEVALSAGVDILVNETIDVNGGDFDGGVVEMSAGNDYLQDDTILANSISGEGFGGEVVIDALRDLTVVEGSVNNRNRVATEGHMGPDFFGGDGGTQEFTAGRDMNLGRFTRFEGNGASPDGLGADLFVSAGRDFFLDGEIEAKARGGQGGGGFIQVESDGDIEIGANGDIDLFGGSTGGGACEILPDGNFVHRGLVDVTGGSNGPGGSIEVESDGDVEIIGTLSGSGSTGSRSDGQIRVQACRVTLNGAGAIDNGIDGGQNTLVVRESARLESGSELIADGSGGSNSIVYRDENKPPVLSGTQTPAVTLLVNADLVGCPVCGNSEIDQGEHCDDGNTDDGDGCSAECLDEGCIEDTPGFPGVPLCDDGVACTIDTCNVSTSSCEHEFLCDDGIACTTDACVDDVCQSTPVNESCDDSDICTDNICTVGVGCTFPNNTASCDDGLFCTTDDVCDAGTCVGSARDCSDGIECTVDGCDEGSDSCTATPDDNACSNDAFCDGVETCDAGSGCVAGTDVDCSDLDDVCLEGVCDEGTDACGTDPANEDGSCDDGLASTENDRCVNGICMGDDIDCSDGIDCTIDRFNEEIEACESIPDNTICDNGDFCDGAETCSAISGCVVPDPIDCSGSGDQCNTGVCDEASDACVAQPSNEGASCDDGLFCTAVDTCEAGVCSGAARSCDDAVVCTVDSCDEDGDACVNTASNGNCDDGLFCNGSEVCDETLDCQAGIAPDCSGLDDQCVTGVCDEDTDACATDNANEGLTCDDGAFCTVDEVCTSGVCAGAARDCSDDGVACTVGSCNEIDDSCSNNADDSVCDDGVFCNGAETCDVVTDCQAGVAVDCSGLDDQCAIGVCDEGADACEAENANEAGACDDGEFCTDGDICTAGECAGTLRPNCLVCGNGIVEPGEECDDGDAEFEDGEPCTSGCTITRCAQPTNPERPRPAASDALYALRAAVRQVTCAISVCDATGDGRITASDALLALNSAVGRDVELKCPDPIFDE